MGIVWEKFGDLLIINYFFVNIEISKAAFIATVSYVGPRVIDSFYYRIKVTGDGVVVYESGADARSN